MLCTGQNGQFHTLNVDFQDIDLPGYNRIERIDGDIAGGIGHQTCRTQPAAL